MARAATFLTNQCVQIVHPHLKVQVLKLKVNESMMEKKLVYTDFKDISMRGRVAFFSTYLERVIIGNNEILDFWKPILVEIWEYTLSNALDEWHEKIAEYLPESVLEDVPFEKKETVYLSRQLHAELHLLYSNAEKEILYFIEQIFYIGTIELYSSIGRNGYQSLLIIETILEYIETNKKELPPLPNVKAFEQFKFADENGWGATFQKNQIPINAGA